MAIRVLRCLRAGFGLAVLAATAFCSGDVQFPGPNPGVARSTYSHGVLKLENGVISQAWNFAHDRLSPLSLSNKLSNEEFGQSGTELFRLALASSHTRTGVAVGIRLEKTRVVALASSDGASWDELAVFPRSEFAGNPKLARLGKMDLHGQAKDHTSDLGEPGTAAISQFSLARPGSIPADFTISAKAHQAFTQEYSVPQGTTFVSCRIDKGTDQGMSWAPGLALVWEDGNKFLLVGARDGKSQFNVTTAAGENIVNRQLAEYPNMDLSASQFELINQPKLIDLTPDTKGVRVADRIGGKAIEAELNSSMGIIAHWRAELRNGSNYIRQTVKFSSPDTSVPLYGVELADAHFPDAKTIGSAPGCPVAGGGMFFGVEMPGAQNAVTPIGFRIGFASKIELSPDQSYSFGSVAGVAPEGQLRRSFLCYVERERARPSVPFLHYNCWYDLGFSVDAANMLDVVSIFKNELVLKRGVPVQSFLIDDGWDEPSKGLWQENLDKFPGGYSALKAQMDRLHANLGIWISPLGGYGGSEKRTADAQKMGLIPVGGALDLAYPKYKEWFQNRCLQLMREDGVNLFKWDRAGSGVSPHFMALLDVAQHLRKQNPNVFINVTVGTWPSPFWLNFVDCTWRNDSPGDVGWAGKGRDSKNRYDRERWLTYRDGYSRKCFVIASPLYPLNSQMLHGIVYGREFQGGSIGKSNGPDLKNEARSYFANGATLQELYLTPSMMTSDAWDSVAEAAKWAHANADVLVDSHWIGGDPLKLQAYGYASWNPKKCTLMLRNPDDQPQTIAIDPATAFELPKGAAAICALRSPYRDQRIQSLKLTAGIKTEIKLDPFEVLVFDGH